MKLHPRITVQYEITGREDIKTLGTLKIMEKAAEIELAQHFGQWVSKTYPGAKLDHIKDGVGQLIKSKDKVNYEHCGKNLYEIIYSMPNVKGEFVKYMIFSSEEALEKHLESWEYESLEMNLLETDISIGIENE